MNSDNDNCDLNLKILPNKTTFSDNINEWGPIILPDTKLPDVNIPKESLTFRNEACDLNLYSYENNKKEFASKNDVLKIIKALNDFDSDLDEDLDLPRIANKNIDTIFKNIKEIGRASCRERV